MTIAKKLKILGHDYTILRRTGDDLQSMGNTQHEKNVIKIRADVPKSQQEETLLHEILRAINNEYREVETEHLAQALYCVLKENRLLK